MRRAFPKHPIYNLHDHSSRETHTLCHGAIRNPTVFKGPFASGRPFSSPMKDARVSGSRDTLHYQMNTMEYTLAHKSTHWYKWKIFARYTHLCDCQSMSAQTLEQYQTCLTSKFSIRSQFYSPPIRSTMHENFWLPCVISMCR